MMFVFLPFFFLWYLIEGVVWATYRTYIMTIWIWRSEVKRWTSRNHPKF